MGTVSGTPDDDLRSSIEQLKAAGYGVIPPQQYCSDMEEEFLSIWEKIRACTMISVERAFSLYSAVKYIVQAEIPGDFTECGVWKGGAAMLIAFTLLAYRPKKLPEIYLFDTFKGMTEPGDKDRIAWNRRPVREKWEEDLQGEKNNFGWWAVPREEVLKNMYSTGYPQNLVIAVEGDVLETVPREAPDQLALLRLDTDWYESTVHELRHLYPRLNTGGVLLIDDYGHFTGARQAVDEFFKNTPVFLHRDDYTGRSVVKI
ncbi:MAG: TylF/MycF/NovP-related O-methyltransferase [Sediminispirochaetaceae bacterium]